MSISTVPPCSHPAASGTIGLMRAAVLGTGIMGAAMARSLAREGHQVTVWNRTPERATAAAGDRITACGAVADAVLDADVVFTMLFDAASVLEVTGEVVGALGSDAVWAQSTTVGPAGMLRIADAAGDDVRARLLDAPVLGTRQPAEAGALTILVSGDSRARASAQPAFDAVGARTLGVGGDLGAASALKLAANSWVASINAATAQAMGLAESLGLEPSLFLEAIRGGAADSAYAQAKGAIMAERSWDDPSFALDSVVKDVGLMVDAARDSGFPDDLLATLLAVYDRASSRGYGGADMAAVRASFDH
jgi:3-hydroxyisobutyrate dehydrogenase